MVCVSSRPRKRGAEQRDIDRMGTRATAAEEAGCRAKGRRSHGYTGHRRLDSIEASEGPSIKVGVRKDDGTRFLHLLTIVLKK